MPPDPLIRGLFPTISEPDWRALAARTVGEGGFASLVSRSQDGLAVGPIYGPAPGGTAVVRTAPGRWTIVQRIDSGNARDVAEKAKADMEGGAGAIDLVFAGAPTARGRGLAGEAAGPILAAVADVPALRIDAGEDTAAILEKVTASALPQSLAVSFDPITVLAASGGLTKPIDVLRAETEAALVAARDRGLKPLRFVGDGRPWHDGGATEAQELAVVLAAAVEHLRFARSRGGGDDGRVGVSLAADAEQFPTVAKFRAMRLLLARVAEIVGRPELALTIHAETSWRMMSRLDPTMNMPRAAVAAFSAGIGGADSITVLPLSLADDEPFARRMARNTQLMLLDEANVAGVADPAAGSGAIEALTAGLAEAAWETFRIIEAAGGLAASVRSGAIQQRIAVEREQRLRSVLDGSVELVGVNVFTDGLAPIAEGTTPPAPPRIGAEPAERAEPLVRQRLAEPFETAFESRP